MTEQQTLTVHPQQIKTIIEMVQEVLSQTTGVISTGITWDLERIEASLEALQTQTV